ncbi:efflux transporter outer membrane subunit [Parvularcula sp. LCG005]|uniref:efflux transporter outer membrane subunit n=1 Tax=Parvularcula sp. LCG005 TaxID=3078805 RepID=UPI002943EA84|nr:efflux transporter outer membrane subunit [Parvularcula sp. LCG005]WOI52502.1 efflux transporter outer membrane subunit [Parvularcula sp. LCG005]
MLSRILLVSASALTLSGCITMAPRYEQPDAPVPSVLPEGDAPDGIDVTGVDWRQVVTSPALTELIETALENNRDLRVAMLNVQAARSQFGITRSARFPSLSASVSQTEQGLMDDDDPDVDPIVAQTLSTDQARAQLAVTAYELDLFGRVTSLNRAALQSYLSQEENARAAELSLIASVANGWLNLVANNRLYQLAEETAGSQEQSLELTKALFDAGVADDLDYQRAVTSVEQAKADRARFAAQRRQSLNALMVLTGAPVSDDLLDRAADDFTPLRLDLTVGQSSDILLTRPDVQAAERTLMARNANIGAARAAFFPRISLTGSAGYASTDLDGLFSDGTGYWSFTPQISLPIFAGGANWSNLRLAKTQRDIALAQYEKSIQNAFRETADALAVAATIDERIAALERLTEAAQRAQFLSEERLRGGVSDYLSVLDAQRQVYQAQQALISARAERASNAVALYLAVGGATPVASN